MSVYEFMQSRKRINYHTDIVLRTPSISIGERILIFSFKALLQVIWVDIPEGTFWRSKCEKPKWSIWLTMLFFWKQWPKRRNFAIMVCTLNWWSQSGRNATIWANAEFLFCGITFTAQCEKRNRKISSCFFWVLGYSYHQKTSGQKNWC